MTLTKSIKSQRMQRRALCLFSLHIHWWAQLFYKVNSRPDVPSNYPPSPRLQHKVFKFIFNASVLSKSQGCLFAEVFPDGRHMGSTQNGDLFCCWTLTTCKDITITFFFLPSINGQFLYLHLPVKSRNVYALLKVSCGVLTIYQINPQWYVLEYLRLQNHVLLLHFIYLFWAI